MKPRTKLTEHPDEVEYMRFQEQFVRQVEDDSLPARQVLTEQKEDRDPDQPAPLFVP